MQLSGTQTFIDPGASHAHQGATYDADHIPADWYLAEAHAKAVLPGKPIKDKIEACPCCMGYVEKESVGYFENTKQLAFLGEGFPLFYNFLRYCIVMLITLILDDGIIGVMLSYNENHCTQLHSSGRLLSGTASELVDCQDNFSNKYAYINGIESVARTAIKITSFVAQILLLLYFRDQQNKMASYIDERNCTMSDYTLYVQNIPKGQSDNRQRITRLLTNNDPSLQVMDILIIENGEEYSNEQKILKKIVENRQQAIKKQAEQDVLDLLNKKYVRQRARIQKLERSIKANENKYFQGEAFVVMNTEEQREKAISILNGLEVTAAQQEYPGYTGQPKMQASEASEPKQIIWQNIHTTKGQRYLSIFWGWLLTLVIMIAVTVGFFFLIRYKGQLIEQAHLHYTEDPKYEKEYTQGVVLGYIIIILINLFNKFIFSTLFHKITHQEKHISVSSSNYSYALKYTLGMFFTTALMTLLVEAIIANNYTGSLGVIEEETSMFIFNAYFTPIVWLVNPYNMVAWIKRKIYYGNNYYTQEQANHLMELPEYNMGKRYAEIIKTVWFTFLYVELIPFGSIYSFTGLLLYYMVDKYILLYRCSIKDSVSSKLSRTMVTVLDFTLVLKPAGELIFDSHLRHQLSISSLVMLCIGVVYILLPVNAILDWVHPQKFQPQEMTYEQVKDSFPETYFTLYPIKQHDTHSKYLKRSKIQLMTQTRSPLKLEQTPVKHLPTDEQQVNQSFDDLLQTRPNKNAIHNYPTSSELPPIKKNARLV